MNKTLTAISLSSLLLSTSLFAGAQAGDTQEVFAGEKIQLNGSQSFTDYGGSIRKYKWRQKTSVLRRRGSPHAPSSPSLSLENANTSNPTFIAPDVNETTVFKVILTTQERIYTKDSVTITVHPNKDIPENNNTTDPIIILHNGFGYQSVTSPVTSRVWLDRNLGASQACESVKDTACFGDLYQWGRGTDGHQLRTSEAHIGITTFENVTDIFYMIFDSASYSYTYDWLRGDDSGSIRQATWAKTDGTSVCPIEYRVPTFEELTAEIDMAFLNLAYAGYREAYESNQIFSVGNRTYLWANTPIQSDAGRAVYYPKSHFGHTATKSRFTGHSIRCIKD